MKIAMPKVHPDFNGAEMQIVDIDVIDMPAFQRDEAEQWSEEIASNWDHLLFRHPYLRPSEPGRFQCIDGQHTVRAAVRRGHSTIPAFVQRIPEIQAAATFSDVNTKRKRLRPVQVWNADLLAGRQWAVDLNDVVTSYGLHVQNATSATTVAAVNQCRMLHRRGGKALLDAVFGVITAAWDDKHRDRVEGLMVGGMGQLILDSQARGNFDPRSFVAKLKRATFAGPFGKVSIAPETMRSYVMYLAESGALPGMGGMVGGEGRNRLYAAALARVVHGVPVARDMYPSFGRR